MPFARARRRCDRGVNDPDNAHSVYRVKFVESSDGYGTITHVVDGCTQARTLLMIMDRRRTITVHFGPDSVADVSVRFVEGDVMAPNAPYPSDRASLDAEPGQALSFRAVADAELVEQLRALVRGDFALSGLTGNSADPAPRCSGERASEP